jgi:hypothetical protein
MASRDPYGGSGVVVVDRFPVNVPIEEKQATQKVGIAANDIIIGGFFGNPYDVGIDFEFYRYSVPVPDYFIEYDENN